MFVISDIKGIKPRQVKLLEEAGISTVESLAMSNPDDLSEIDGISDKASKTLVWAAREQLGMGSFSPASDLRENFDYITTGSDNLDKILTPPGSDEGGISTGRITEVFGAFKSGKTNLSSTLCVTAQLPVDEGGLGCSVLFIDTENTFSKEKIKRIARRFGLDPEFVLRNIYHVRIYSSDHQLQMIKACEKAVQEKGARLIIIDSLMALLRNEFIGIGLLARRQQLLNNMIHSLSRIAETHNVAVLLTNQVATVMKGTFSSQDAIGGNIVAHGCHFRIQFKAKGFSMNSSLERTATIVDAPDLAPESANFFITEAGISDTEKVEYLLSVDDVQQMREDGISDDFELISVAQEGNNIEITDSELSQEEEHQASKSKSSSKGKKSTSKKSSAKKSSSKKAAAKKKSKKKSSSKK